MASNAPQEDLANIDEEIRTLEDRLLYLRSTRNTLIPIARLPAEILHIIFNIARSQGTHTIHLSWVSRAWRDLVLGSNTLWTLVQNSNLRWTTIYLERSFPAPLIVRLEDSFQNKNLFSTIMGQLSRIKALILPVDEWDYNTAPIVQEAFLRQGPSPLPCVDRMKLTQGNMTHDVLLSLRNARHLSFRWCHHHWTIQPPLFSYLRSLCLAAPNADVSVYEFLGYLENMPTLQLLVLIRPFEAISDRDSMMPRRPFINGPKLQILNMMEGELERYIMFLQKAGCVTQETNVSIKMQSWEVPWDEIRKILVPFEDWAINMGDRQSLTHLGFDARGSTGSIVVEYGSTAASTGYAHLQATFQPRLSNDLTIVVTISRLISLLKLQFVFIHLDEYEVDAGSWPQQLVDVFGQLPELHHLVIVVPSTPVAAIDLLLVSMTAEFSPLLDQTEGVPQRPLFSALKTLIFPNGFPSDETLLAFLQSRNSYGLTLETLGLASSTNIGAVWGGFVENIVDAGRENYLKQECYDFLSRVDDNQDIPLEIS